MAMGTANKVPGVSGGTVAFVAGFYEEFIFSLQRINKKAWGLLFAGRFRSLFYYINGPFLLALTFGSLISFFSISQLLDYLLMNYEIYVWSWFFGMILGSIYYISINFKGWNWKYASWVALGTFIGLAISFLSPATENTNLLFVFLCGIISVCGMTLPGLSGSFILMIIGNYVLLLVTSVNALYRVITQMAVLNFGVFQEADTMRMVLILLVFTLGSTVGLISLSHLLGYVLARYHNRVITLIIGFITGSLGIVWPWKEKTYRMMEDGSLMLNRSGKPIVAKYTHYMPDFSAWDTWLAIGMIAMGIVTIALLEYYGKQQKKHVRSELSTKAKELRSGR